MQPHSSLVRSVAPSVLPVTLEEVKRHVVVTHTDDDVYLDELMRVAVEAIDGKGALGRAMITQTWHQWTSAQPGRVRALMTPFQALTDVSYYDQDGVLQQATLAEFQATGTPDETLIWPRDGFSWPSTEDRHDAIRLTYTAGYGATAASVPRSVRHAIVMMVAHWYRHREPVKDGTLAEVPYAAAYLLGLEQVSWYG